MGYIYFLDSFCFMLSSDGTDERLVVSDTQTEPSAGFIKVISPTWQ